MGRKPLNGKAPMTREERNARARLLRLQPANLAAEKKRQKAYREAHKDERKAKDAEKRELLNAQKAAWRRKNHDKVREAWKRYISKNRAKVRERQRERRKDPAFMERRRELARERMKDPKVANRRHWMRRLRYEINKHKPIGIRNRFLNQWRSRWEALVACSDEEAIERYHRRCTVETWSYFIKWRRGGVEALEELWGVKV